jgi:hypothetical protein
MQSTRMEATRVYRQRAQTTCTDNVHRQSSQTECTETLGIHTFPHLYSGTSQEFAIGCPSTLYWGTSQRVCHRLSIHPVCAHGYLAKSLPSVTPSTRLQPGVPLDVPAKPRTRSRAPVLLHAGKTSALSCECTTLLKHKVHRDTWNAHVYSGTGTSQRVCRLLHHPPASKLQCRTMSPRRRELAPVLPCSGAPACGKDFRCEL